MFDRLNEREKLMLQDYHATKDMVDRLADVTQDPVVKNALEIISSSMRINMWRFLTMGDDGQMFIHPYVKKVLQGE